MAEYTWPVRVYYEDTDAGGVVYHASYLRFFERARTEYLRALGFEQDRLRERAGVVFAVRSVTIEYLRPARFNDLLTVTCVLTGYRHASLDFSQAARKDGALLCEARVRVACLDAGTFRPRPLPKSLRTALHLHESIPA